MVDRLHDAWTADFDEKSQKKENQLGGVDRQVERVAQASTHSDAKVIPPSQIKIPVDSAGVSKALENLQLLSRAINPRDVPDIKIASVELGPVLRWLVDIFRPSSENKVVIFDESSAALIEGPIIAGGRTILTLGPVANSEKRTALELVEPVTYEILTSKLRSTDPKIDFGNWSALRDFVVGTKKMAKLVSEPRPSQDESHKWHKQVGEAAELIKHAGIDARDWKLITLASFLFERSKDFDNAIQLLDHYAEFTHGNDRAEHEREARLEYLRERRVEWAVASALQERRGDGTVFTTTTTALAKLPSMVAARKLHRLDGAPRDKIKIAIVSGANPPWFGLDRPPDPVPVEDFLDHYGAELAQVVRALSPSADVMFVPVARRESGTFSDTDLVSTLEKLTNTDAPVILLPFGPLRGSTMAQALDRLIETGHLVVVPAGNTGDQTEFPLAGKILAAEAVGPDGRRCCYSSQVNGGLGALGELPTVDLTEAGTPTVFVGTGTGYAAAALGAIAVESIARQRTLKGTALREALINAAHAPIEAKNPPIARVVIPH